MLEIPAVFSPSGALSLVEWTDRQTNQGKELEGGFQVSERPEGLRLAQGHNPTPTNVKTALLVEVGVPEVEPRVRN